MVFSIDFNDWLQCYATEVSRVWRNRIFPTKLLVSTMSIANYLPNIQCEFVSAGPLMTSKRRRLRITFGSFFHAAPLVHHRDRSAPHPQPFSPFHEGEHHSPSWNGEKGASLSWAFNHNEMVKRSHPSASFFVVHMCVGRVVSKLPCLQGNQTAPVADAGANPIEPVV